MDHCWSLSRDSLASETMRNGFRRQPTFANLDLRAGVAFGHIFDLSHNLGHDGQLWALVERRLKNLYRIPRRGLSWERSLRRCSAQREKGGDVVQHGRRDALEPEAVGRS